MDKRQVENEISLTVKLDRKPVGYKTIWTENKLKSRQYGQKTIWTEVDLDKRQFGQKIIWTEGIIPG